MKIAETLNNLIQWAVLNRFDIEAQDGTKLVVIDYEELIKEILALSDNLENKIKQHGTRI
jgi:hypothetical protein